MEVISFNRECRHSVSVRNAVLGKFYLRRNCAICVGSIPQLAYLISSPCPYRTVSLHGKAMLCSAVNGDDITEVFYLYRFVSVFPCPVSHLAIRIPSPCPYRAVRKKRHTVCPSCNHCSNIIDTFYFYRCLSISGNGVP